MVHRHLPRTLTLLLILMTAALATYWVLLFTSNRETTEPVVPVSLGNTTPRSMAADTSAVATLLGATAGADIGDVKVLGIISEGRAGTGIAVIAYQGSPTKTIKAGEEISPGVILTDVETDGVILTQDGRSRRVLFPTSPPPTNTIAPAR